MKSYVTQCLLLLFSSLSIAQSDNWYTPTIERLSEIGNTPYAGIVEGENNVRVFAGRQFSTWSAYGKELLRYKTNGSILSNVFYADAQDDYFVYVNIKYLGTGDALFMNSINKNGEHGVTNLVLPDSPPTEGGQGPAGVKIGENRFLIIGQTQMHLVEFADFTTAEILWSKNHNFGLITKAIMQGDKIILAGQNGQANFLNLDGSLHLTRDYNFPIYTVAALTDGLVFAGQNGRMAITNTLGFLQKEMTAVAFAVNDATGTTDGGFAVTGKTLDERAFIRRFDANGNLLWNKFLDADQGFNIRKSKYTDELYLTVGIEREIRFYKIGDNGELGLPTLEKGVFPLDVNNIIAKLYGTGEKYYNYPNGENTQLISSALVWMAGKENDSFSGAVNGFFSAIYNGDSSTFLFDFDFIEPWSMSQNEIDKFTADIADGQKDLPWTRDYLNWPAKGNLITVGDKSELITFDLAPFHDVDGDGLYDPFQGDYPAIKGDQMIWFSLYGVFRAAVQVSFYAFNCSEESILNNTTFLEYNMVCHSTSSYEQVKMGMGMNADIGCAADDYIGSIPEYNSAYTYNNGAIDGDENNECITEEISFVDEIPLQSMTILNHPMTAFTYFEEDDSLDVELGSTDTLYRQKVFNYLSGKWADGTPLTYGGTGYDSSNTDLASYAFDGDPSDPTQWSQCSINSESNDKQRSVAAVSIGDLRMGDSIELVTAFITHPDVPLPCPNLDQVKSNIQIVQDFYNLTKGEVVRDFFPDTILVEAESYILDPSLNAAQYNWSTGEQTATIEIFNTGSYTLEIEYGGLCAIQDEVFVQFKNEKPDEGLLIYPNPSLGDFTVEYGKWEVGQERYVRIYSAIGQLIDEFKLTILPAKKLEFSIPDLPYGVYVLSVFLPSGERELSGKIVLGD